MYLPGNQLVPPTSPYYDKDFPVQPANIERARQLVKEAGYDRVRISRSPFERHAGAPNCADHPGDGEAGWFRSGAATGRDGTAVQNYFSGNFVLFNGLWSGRTDPDGNFYPWIACSGSQNFGKYCNKTVDAVLNSRHGETTDFEKRKADYGKATAQMLKDLPTIPIYHQVWVFAASKELKGFVPYVDDIVRPVGLRIGN